MPKKRMRETELAAELIPWLRDQHYEIYPEFSHGAGSIDILAIREPISWAIEVKTTFSLNVLEQATKNLTLYRSVFVPYSNSRGRKIYEIAKLVYKVGVIEYNNRTYNIHERVKPPLMREHYRYYKKMIANLTDLHKVYAIAGSKNTDRLTPYRMTMMDVKRFIRANPGCTISDIQKHLEKRHYSSNQSFKQSVSIA